MQDQDIKPTTSETNDSLVGLTAAIVSSYVGGGGNHIAGSDLPALIKQVHGALSGLDGSAQPQQELTPFVPVRQSIKPDYIVCLEDGKKLKMLKRYLMTKFSMTPDQYRAKWGLPADYPMVAPNYAETRRKLAHSIGLGRKRTRTTATEASGATATASRRTRKSESAPKVDGRSKAARAAKAGGRGRKAKASA
jgi:predicted transcriptional regulator